MQRTYLLFLFFLSGLSGLIYEIAWVRQASLTFGVSLYAYSAVLAAYMIGLALGSYWLGRQVDLGSRPLRTYAGLEVGIACLAALSPFALTPLNGLYAAVTHALRPDLGLLTLLRLALSILTLTPPTFLIGATLPVMSRIYAARSGQVGDDLGRLYAANTAGAVLGCLLSSVFLIRLLGLRETIFVGAALNVLVAGGALWLERRAKGVAEPATVLIRLTKVGLHATVPSRTSMSGLRRYAGSIRLRITPIDGALMVARQLYRRAGEAWRVNQFRLTGIAKTARPLASPHPPSPPRLRGRPQPSPPGRELSSGAWRYIGLSYAISGFVTLAYEVVWARILSIHTLHAIYSFALMLTVLLAGLALGGALGAWWVRRRQVSLVDFGALQLGIGLLAILALFVFARLPAWPIEDVLGGYSVAREVLYELLLASITLFPSTLLIGGLFPVVSSLYTRERTEEVGRRIGTLSALNTLGAILGALCAGFLLVPLLGLRNTSLALSAVNLALGAGALWLAERGQQRAGWKSLPVLGVALLTAWVIPPGVYLGFREGTSEHLVFYEEGVETTVAVFDVPDQNFKISFVNGRTEVPTDETSMRAFHLLGHLPPLLRPQARNALVLSFGNGIATGSLDAHNIPAIDAVDLSPEMIEAARLYWEENYNVLRSPRLRLHVEDARNFLLRTDQQYDIMTTDATHPSNASSWALFTQEFYELARRRLSPDGVFMQWLPFHSLTEADYRAIIRTCRRVFPHTTLWYTGGSHTFLVATPHPLAEETLTARLAQAADNTIVRDDLGPSDVIRSYLALDEATLDAYAGPGPSVTDNKAFFLPSNAETEAILANLLAAMER